MTEKNEITVMHKETLQNGYKELKNMVDTDENEIYEHKAQKSKSKWLMNMWKCAASSPMLGKYELTKKETT